MAGGGKIVKEVNNLTNKKNIENTCVNFTREGMNTVRREVCDSAVLTVPAPKEV